jgi:hypothetical protein
MQIFRMDLTTREDPHGKQLDQKKLAEQPHMQIMRSRTRKPNTLMQGLYLLQATMGHF